MSIEIIHGDNLPILKSKDSGSFDLIYIDPPFNTGSTQKGRAGSYDEVLDFFAGSGTTGKACEELERNCLLIDQNPEAISVMEKRFNCPS